jgi:hypothetical protein
VPKLNFIRRAAMGAAMLAAAATTTIASTGAAQAADASGTYLYWNSSPGCVAQLDFYRVPSGNNLAEAEISSFNLPDGYDACVGALYRSNDGGSTWYRISGVHTIWGSGPNQTSTTYQYSDGANYLAKACVRTYYGHSDTWSAWACTSAHY